MALKSISNIKNSINVFFYQHPALHLGMTLLIGVASTFHILYLFLALALLFFEKKRLTLLILGGGYLYASLLHQGLTLESPLEGRGTFQIHQVKRHSAPFKPLLVYEGMLSGFQKEGKTYNKLPCRLYMPIVKNRPLADHDYLLTDISLMEIAPFHYILKTTNETTWIPLLNSKSFAEWRFQTKEKTRSFVKKTFRKKSVQTLFIALLTGQKESRLQTYQFGLIGLQHLLAISGFHFALLTFFLATLLRLFLPRKILALTLIFLLSLYFFYMGEAPSISRAWIGVIIFLGGMILERKSSPLNALGLGLTAALIYKPLVIFDVGCQLSFAATFGILLFYTSFEKHLQKLFPKRPFHIVKEMSRLDQGGLLVVAYLRKVLALSGAVMTFTLPLLLVHFHRFPIMSLFYNLFFPLLFSLMIAFFLLSLLLPFLFPALESYSDFLLRLVEHAPKKALVNLQFSHFPQEIALVICLTFFVWGVYFKWSSSLIKEWHLG